MTPCQLILIFSDATENVDPHRGGRDHRMHRGGEERARGGEEVRNACTIDQTAEFPWQPLQYQLITIDYELRRPSACAWLAVEAAFWPVSTAAATWLMHRDYP